MNRLTVTYRDALGVFLVTAFVGAIGFLLTLSYPKQNEQVIIYMLGQLSGFVSAVIAGQYNASRNSEKANENIGKALDAINSSKETQQ